MSLTSIEQFHLAADGADHPNLLFCKLLVRGNLDRSILEKAIERVTKRHLLWNRRLAAQNRKPVWIAKPDCQTSLLSWIDVSADQSNEEAFMPSGLDLRRKLDLESTPGAHVWCQASRQYAVLFLAIHHSVCDGLGGTRIISEILIAHDNLVADRPWDDGLKQLDLERLLQRHRIGLNKWSYWKHFWKQPIALAGMAKFLFRGFYVIKKGQTNAHVKDVDGGSQSSGLVGRWISKDLSALIDRVAARKEVAVNAIAMASVFYALPEWSRQQNDRPAEKWFRMVLPISIASKSDLRSPITNRATIVQVDRCENQMREADSFLHYLDREIKIIVGWEFDKIFLLMIRLMSVSRWWLHRVANNPRARGTIVFTNLGQPFRSFEKRAKRVARSIQDSDTSTEIVDFDFAGPTRSAMPLSFTIQRHQQRYRISARFDERVLASEQAASFLERVEIELSKLAGADR